MKKLHVMVKPVGAACNLDCTYCYYLSKSDLLDYRGEFKMNYASLEQFIKQYIQAHNAPEILFTWQGGEPTLLGIDYFKKVVELQQKYCPQGSVILNDLQTNGVLLNDKWCQFLKENRFIVGLSIDGPKAIHDYYRVNKAGKGSFEQVYRSVLLLQKHQVPFATLTCINNHSAQYALEIYQFLRDVLQSPQIQFIPIVEHSSFTAESSTQALIDVKVVGANAATNVTSWSVSAQQWGQFLCTVFDEWYENDIGKENVIYFEAMFQIWLGMTSPICTHAPLCGKGLAMELNGDVYSCDHFVYPDYKLGNINDHQLDEMAFSKKQEDFGRGKSTTLTPQCQRCDYLFACYGECPKNRIATDKAGNIGHNFLCQGWYMFYSYIDERLAKLIKSKGLSVSKGAYKAKLAKVR
ncbi:anaerobic sulfatase maturase [Shewanella halifaxensis]|nr:anaerobic sulfatase maturase [Shewanella halifaxensis]